jgi:hypothetical protein
LADFLAVEEKIEALGGIEFGVHGRGPCRALSLREAGKSRKSPR